MAKRTLSELQQLQGLPLAVKIEKTKQRIKEWVDYYGEDGVYVSFSGGKDSTVLLHLVREVCGYKNVEAVYCDTGLEFPEIRQFVKTFDNVRFIKPKKTMMQIVKEYGYPIISKEVTEAVYGARRYLTEAINRGIIDRPTDRPTAFHMLNFIGN